MKNQTGWKNLAVGIGLSIALLATAVSVGLTAVDSRPDPSLQRTNIVQILGWPVQMFLPGLPKFGLSDQTGQGLTFLNGNVPVWSTGPATVGRWKSLAQQTIIFDSLGSDLKNLATATYMLGTTTVQVDPSTAPMYAMYQYKAKIQATATKGVLAKAWFIVDIGNTGNFDSTNATNTPDRAPDFVFNGYALTTTQYLTSIPSIVQRPPYNFKILWQNSSGATTTNVNNDNQLLESVLLEQRGP